jgi:hypothetical protein
MKTRLLETSFKIAVGSLWKNNKIVRIVEIVEVVKLLKLL